MMKEREPQDATNFLKSQERQGETGHPVYKFERAPVYNIDDMDHTAYMRDHRMEGVYCLAAAVPIDPQKPGKVYVNGEYSGEAIVSGFGNSIGLPVRRKIQRYDSNYEILCTGAYTVQGDPVPDFTFSLRTLPKIVPGIVFPEHDALVLQGAREGAVLLKNENLLPLEKGSSVNIFGIGGATYRLGCAGAGKINPRYGIRLEEGIRSYSSLKINEELFQFYKEEATQIPTADLVKQARTISDIAVVVLTRGTGESQDNRPQKGSYYLTDEEHAMFSAIKAEFDKVVVILNVGYPIEMGWIEEYGVGAVLWSGLNGMAGGRAVAEILEGTVSPSGRLPDTWSYDYYDIPSSKNFYVLGDHEMSVPDVKDTFVRTVYEEGLYVGYRYFQTFQKPVAFPFGHGLSYTVFEKKVTHASANAVEVQVRNCGRVPGKETVLIFAELTDGKLEQPSRRLVAFGKTRELMPDETETLHLEIASDRYRSYDESSASWIIEKGEITLYLGGSVAQAQPVYTFAGKGEVLETVKNRVYPLHKVKELSKSNPEDTYPTGKYSGRVEVSVLPEKRIREKYPEKRIVTETKNGTEGKITFPMVRENLSLLEDFVVQLSDYELCRMSVGGRTGWGYGDIGFAGTLYTEGMLEKYELPEYYMSDGNNGLNLNDATIGFPVSNIMCATFNEELLYEEGKAIAREGKEKNIHCILAPAINLHRNPLCGRHAEYFSEDPFLAGRMGGMECKGLESMGMLTTLKHFFANNAENYRTVNHSILSERTARELYLEAFKVAMEVQEPSAFMTSYNAANGCWCAADPELLEGILREEWGFQGFVMTDWGTCMYVPCDEIAAAGNSWIAPGSMDDTFVTPLLEGLKNGTLDRERMRRNVYDMIGTIASQLNRWDKEKEKEKEKEEETWTEK